MRRSRLSAVAAIVACGGLGVISSTQTWLTVLLDGGAGQALDVAGADAVPVLAPLSLAALPLGAALSIVGVVLRRVFGTLSALIGAVLVWVSGTVLFSDRTDVVAPTVTAATGIAGREGVSDLVTAITVTAWPAIALAVGIILTAAGGFTVATARSWPGTGRRYRTEDEPPRQRGSSSSRPHDAVDDWDDLSRGEDPTA